ncbi:hypothetical protein ACFO3J_30350 [Streptomyces polygonati]|uniref:Uncharacterized protein n=1 Tax=Streptomyces polygonati TaxID=1617087 RepID=A0ABV8HXW0_9ACTN
MDENEAYFVRIAAEHDSLKSQEARETFRDDRGLTFSQVLYGRKVAERNANDAQASSAAVPPRRPVISAGRKRDDSRPSLVGPPRGPRIAVSRAKDRRRQPETIVVVILLG